MKITRNPNPQEPRAFQRGDILESTSGSGALYLLGRHIEGDYFEWLSLDYCLSYRRGSFSRTCFKLYEGTITLENKK